MPALELLMEAGRSPITVDTIAERAGVGKQTIYRWWPSKYAVVLDAISGHARARHPDPRHRHAARRSHGVYPRSFRGACDAATAGALRLMAAEAQHNTQAGDLLRGFTERRRAALREVLERGQRRGELAPPPIWCCWWIRLTACSGIAYWSDTRR